MDRREATATIARLIGAAVVVGVILYVAVRVSLS